MFAGVGILLMFAATAQAAPLLVSKTVSFIHDETLRTQVGVPATNRTIFTVISLTCMGTLSFLLGLRFKKLKRSILRKRNFISILVVIIYTLVSAFILAAAVLVAGQGLTTYKLCLAGTWVCLILYTFTKAAIFLFLVERIHIVRAPFVLRRHDKIYLACLAIVVFMFGPVIINSYVNPVISMGPTKTRCYFGIRGKASIPVLAVNMFVDLILTGVFFYLLRPAVKHPGFRDVPIALKSQFRKGSMPLAPIVTNETAVQRSIRTLLWKSIVGSLMIEIPMMANMIQFVVTKGEELGTICMALCVVELVWDALVIYWLVLGTSEQAEKCFEYSASQSNPWSFTATEAYIQYEQGRDGTSRKDRRAFCVMRPEAVRTKPLGLLYEPASIVDRASLSYQ